MSRLPFDPQRVSGPEEPVRPARREARHRGLATEANRLTVGQVVELIKSTLEGHVPSPLHVIGQVSNLRVQGHWYFSLKDDSAVLHCVVWASSAIRFGAVPKDGDEVVATGHVSHYGPQGRTQLYVTSLQPVGAGALEQRFRALCDELRKSGYFDDARKKPLPAFPRRVAIITSAGGAAVHDVLVTAAQRCRAVAMMVVDVRVQGEGAAEQVARAIHWVDAEHVRLSVDAILVTRGGGSIEDLWAFNERVVADAALACSIPLVAAIGHESDTTVIELVADVRAATPTQAAMRLVPSSAELVQQIDHGRQRMGFLMRRLLQQCQHRVRLVQRHPWLADAGSSFARARERWRHARARLERSMGERLTARRVQLERGVARLGHLRPQDVAARRRQALAVLADRLQLALRRRIAQRPVVEWAVRRLGQSAAARLGARAQVVAALERQLQALGPHRVLRRGYSITMTAEGRIVRLVDQVRAGQPIVTRVADGSIDSVVGGGGSHARGRVRPRHASQMDLFDGQV